MVLELKDFITVKLMLVITKKIDQTDKVNTIGRTVIITRDNSLMV
jgi:hypothetical protein